MVLLAVISSTVLPSIPCSGFMDVVIENPQAGADLVLEALMEGTDYKSKLANKFITGGRLNSRNTLDVLMGNVCDGDIWYDTTPPSSSGNVGGNVYNSVVKYGIFLPFSRNMESEADYLGMAFMNLSGFDIKEPSKLWGRMMLEQKKSIPEFMSSHPNPENRSNSFQEWEREIMDKFPTI